MSGNWQNGEWIAEIGTIQNKISSLLNLCLPRISNDMLLDLFRSYHQILLPLHQLTPFS